MNWRRASRLKPSQLLATASSIGSMISPLPPHTASREPETSPTSHPWECYAISREMINGPWELGTHSFLYVTKNLLNAKCQLLKMMDTPLYSDQGLGLLDI